MALSHAASLLIQPRRPTCHSQPERGREELLRIGWNASIRYPVPRWLEAGHLRRKPAHAISPSPMTRCTSGVPRPCSSRGSAEMRSACRRQRPRAWQITFRYGVDTNATSPLSATGAGGDSPILRPSQELTALVKAIGTHSRSATARPPPSFAVPLYSRMNGKALCPSQPSGRWTPKKSSTVGPMSSVRTR